MSDTVSIALSLVYGVLAVVGMCGNCWVLWLLTCQLRDGRRTRSSHTAGSNSMVRRLGSAPSFQHHSGATPLVRQQQQQQQRSQTYLQQHPSNPMLASTRNLSTSTSVRLRVDRSKPMSTYWILLCLSLTDFLCVCTLPLLVTDINVGWVFGQGICKLFMLGECLNKFLSPLILAALSYDRYSIICNHGWPRLKWLNGLLLGALTCSGIVALALMHTIVYYVEVIKVPANISDSISSKCMFKPPENLILPYFHSPIDVYHVIDIGQLVFCFLLPLFVICVVYTVILVRIYHHTQRSMMDGQSAISMSRVARCSALVVIFYFACWMPYFVNRFYLVVAGFDTHDLYHDHNYGAVASNGTNSTKSSLIHGDFHATSSASEDDIYLSSVIAYFIHTLPYFQAAFNWLLYVYLNRYLRDSAPRSMSFGREFSAGASLTSIRNHIHSKFNRFSMTSHSQNQSTKITPPIRTAHSHNGVPMPGTVQQTNGHVQASHETNGHTPLSMNETRAVVGQASSALWLTNGLHNTSHDLDTYL